MTDPIIIVPYDTKWVSTFEHERKYLLIVLEDVDAQVEHIGSTSVPGLDAKPIVDIMVVAQNPGDAVRCITPILRLGYVCLGEAGIAGRIYFRRGSPHTHHLHLYTSPTNPECERHLLFRDYLRAHPETAREYSELKYALAQRFRNDRDQYSKSKSDFVESVVQAARAEMEKGKLEG